MNEIEKFLLQYMNFLKKMDVNNRTTRFISTNFKHLNLITYFGFTNLYPDKRREKKNN